ncbi:DUF262 domain-containing protein [Enterococcus hulanensis]|uniref:DUF262 domain-containing protein n=1 Tax=Enterococcus hulanensis TaxID=2559929 RepID=A0ABU3EVC1_9ENTE|nr:DUF262 domain-containing protein [Enterococcus hulanensis]MDT2598611.1 DUF262 domain-containing protein [Enterococcus hulanensis]MDT2607884.1 DUF262 domain-containing protein [Enterococcus hulanensis]MDT2615179.1 DUF262 domain-containing protein [Enterococcus hulanensis]MDT2626850.1 DUF262 domain-containing protein [Enterococcus hulanensis]MDT2654251.1 DUF262 domain-containing protein [Enterococcus hulanensis]
MDINLVVNHHNFESLFSNEKFLKNAVFNIPRYQRVYSWSIEEKNHEKKREVDDFWDDIIARSKTQESDYFGSVLLNKKEVLGLTKYEIVDGQQRLITALLLYKALGADLHKEKLPISLGSERDNIIMKKILLDEQLENEEKRTKIAQAYNFFIKKLKGRDKNQLLSYFKNIQISIAIINNEYESNLLFGRLNTRGLPLSDADLIKYEIFKHYDKCSGIAGEDDPLATWKKIQTILYDNISKNLTIDNFMFYWWRINNPTIGFSFERFKTTYRVEDYMKDFLLPILESVNRIDHYICNDTGSDNGISENVKQLFDFKILHRDSGAEIALLRVLLSDLDNKSKKSIIDILTLTEAFQYTLEIKQVSNTFENVQHYFKKEIVTDGEGAILDKLCENIRKDTFRNDIREVMINSVSKLRYPTSRTQFSNKNKSAEKILLQYTLLRLADTTQTHHVSIEHIIDKSKGGVDENSLFFQLGNTVLLEKRINNSLSEIKELNKKIPEYKKSEIRQMKEFLYRKKGQSVGWKVDKENSWNPELFSKNHIESRGKYLATMLFNELQYYIKEYQERNK